MQVSRNGKCEKLEKGGGFGCLTPPPISLLGKGRMEVHSLTDFRWQKISRPPPDKNLVCYWRRHEWGSCKDSFNPSSFPGRKSNRIALSFCNCWEVKITVLELDMSCKQFPAGVFVMQVFQTAKQEILNQAVGHNVQIPWKWVRVSPM